MVAWMLVIHLIGLVFWLGSLLAATHVLAVHAQESSEEARAALGRLEKKILDGLAHPGLALMVGSGIILLFLQPYAIRELWMHVKLFMVLVLIGLDVKVYRRTESFQAGAIELRREECMIWHGVIAAVFLAILVLVMVKPFS